MSAHRYPFLFAALGEAANQLPNEIAQPLESTLAANQTADSISLLGSLQRIDLSHHYISAAWQQKLQALPCTVVLDDPEEEDDGDRYVAVSE